MKKTVVLTWLCSLCLFSLSSQAGTWQQEPDARLQLHQLGLELALADVHPAITQRWQRAVLADTASETADDELWLALSAFWREWSAMDFEARQYLRTRKLSLVASAEERERLLQAAGSDPQAGDRQALVNKLVPGFGDYHSLKIQLARLLAMADEPWPAIAGATLRPGDEAAAVLLLRKRLQRLGDMPAGEPGLHPELFDEPLAQAVKAFQARHGLTTDGVVGKRTYAWLDTTPRVRAQLLMRSMLRTLIGDSLPPSYMLVNIPEYRLRLYQEQVMVLESDVIVGRNSRKTPIMYSQITNVVVNPPWNVPRSILQKDIVPKLYRDPGYIERMGFEVIDSAGNVVSGEEWQYVLYMENRFPFRLRQKPGSNNALGSWKFHLPNNDAIYLHDTPARGLFSRNSRALSSGCVRVENAEQLAEWLLSANWSREGLAKLKSSKRTRWLKVQDPLPVYMVYWRGWLAGSELPQFRDDIYKFDRTLSDPFKSSLAKDQMSLSGRASASL
ncbi:L,D-transpeptidase family protein [Oceanimonas baumannii]|uniref:L,D-transpeptidase family protein n=1 Tax=Oceanimonas baumannii TaxID=129578 RepID=UPI001D190E4A|nr:L,D-transpeptidase family protein [Oceanimonas baumannii]MCC4263196.1 L,D-transpeptidase family protein [Oceanimonas baumannii]